MYIVKNPARSRPLSSNVLRLMMLSRSAPKNEAVIKLDREYSPRDLACCAKQGEIFMEASSMGLKMEEFAPTYMMSQIAGIFDVYFCTSGRQKLFELIEVPIFLEKPATVVEAIYWIDDIISHAKEDENKSLAISKAYEAQTRYLLKETAILMNFPMLTGLVIFTAVNAFSMRNQVGWCTGLFQKKS